MNGRRECSPSLATSWFLGAIFILSLLGCSPQVRAVNRADTARETKASGAEAAAEPETETPPPPPARATTASAGPLRATLERGPDVCIVPRPDFRSTFIRMEAPSLLAPETMGLLQAWIYQAWQAELPATTLDLGAAECQSAFVCARLHSLHVEAALVALLRVLDAPPSAAFYAARPVALESAAGLDQSDPNWKMQTTAHALLAPGTTLRLLLEKEPPPPPLEIERALGREAGRSRMARAGFAELAEAAADLVEEATLTVTTSAPAAPLLSRAQALWAQKAATPRKAPRTAGPAAPVATATAPIILSERAGEWSRGLFLVPPASHGEIHLIDVALRVVATRLSKAPSGARSIAQSPHGLYALPVVVLDGPYEAVLSDLEAIRRSYSEVSAAPETVTAAEFEQASFRRRAEVRHALSCPTATVDDPKRLGPALRAAGSPVSLVWGAPHETTQEEWTE